MSPKLHFAAIFWCVTAYLGMWASYAQECGRAPILENRIVGGLDASDGAWPWQVAIQQNGRHICGGSIITENWILSAAHCITNPSDLSSYIVYAGRYQLNGYNSHQLTREVSRVVMPSGYVEPHSGQDMALLQLSSPLTWSDYIHPICLPASGTLFPSGMRCYVTGWGNIRQEVPLSGIGTLQEVQVPIISQSECEEMYQNIPKDKVDILYDMICAGYKEGGKDACQGDSGGPLVCQMVNGTWVQAGVVSFGVGCAQANQPGVYTRLSSYSSFITNIVPEIKLYGRAHHNWGGETSVLVSFLSALVYLLQG